MAKWGEGDPRWIVEERPDATNVNNWHWTEKNADQWSKKKLEDLLVGDLDLGRDLGAVTVTEMDKCEGEARVNNRKAKLIFFYEWEIVLKWKSAKADGDDGEDGDKDVEGKITVVNLSEEHTDMEDVDLEVTVSKGKSAKRSGPIKDSLRKGAGAKAVRKRLAEYVEALKSEYGQGLILPPKDAAAAASTTAKPDATPTASQPKKLSTSAEKKAAGEVQSAMKGLGIQNQEMETIKITERFKCTGQELFNALTQKEMIQVFTCGPVVMEKAEAGREFALLDGNISGSFLEVKPFVKVRQRWRLRDWPEGHHSEVEFSIEQSTDDTRLDIRQTGVPAKLVENTKAGWRRYYVDAIKRSFGFGSGIF